MTKIIALVLILAPGLLLAEINTTTTTAKPHIGGLVGLANPSRDAIAAKSNFGVDVGFQPYQNIGVGLSASYMQDRVNGTNYSNTVIPILIETAYHFGQETAKGLLHRVHVGTKQGVILDSFASYSGDERGVPLDYQSFGFGPLLGYDYMVNNKFSIGGEAQYVFSFGRSTSLFGISAMLKYWL